MCLHTEMNFNSNSNMECTVEVIFIGMAKLTDPAQLSLYRIE